jgi:hypothetical protein
MEMHGMSGMINKYNLQTGRTRRMDDIAVMLTVQL